MLPHQRHFIGHHLPIYFRRREKRTICVDCELGINVGTKALLGHDVMPAKTSDSLMYSGVLQGDVR